MEPYVAALGHVTADQYYKCLQDIVPGDKFFVRYIETLPGGMVANAACVLGKMGTPTYFITALGQDEQTQFLLDSFAPAGVKMNFVKILRGYKNFCTNIMQHPDGKERTIMLYEVEKPVAVLDVPTREALLNASFVYGLPCDFRSLPDYQKLMTEMKGRGVRFMFDAECNTFTSRENQEDAFIFCMADILSLNDEAVLQFCDGPDESPVDQYVAGTDKIVLITRGAKGCTVVADGVRFDVACYPVHVEDTTGAGDTFNASFLHAYMKNMSLEDCARYATAAANRCVEGCGARFGACTEAEVLSFQKERSH